MGGVKPPALEPGLAYLQVTSSSAPQAIQDNFAASHTDYSIRYLGPVGELKGEHIFQIDSAAGGHVKRDELPSVVVTLVKSVDGVQGAKILETKQRTKRDEF